MAKRKPGLPKKFAKMGFKKGWRAFKATLKKGGRAVKRKVASKRPKTPSRSTSKTVSRTSQKRATPARSTGGKTMAKKFNWKQNKIIVAGANGATVSVGVIVPAIAMETIPQLKEVHVGLKSGGQFAVGAFTWILAKNPWIKKLGVGVMAGSILTLALPMIRDRGFKIFGPAKGKLTPAEMAQLRLNAQGMGGPVNKVYGPVNKVYGPISVIRDSEVPYMNGRSRFSAGNFRTPRN